MLVRLTRLEFTVGKEYYLVCEIYLLYYVIGSLVLNVLFANKAYLVVSSGNPNKMTTSGNNNLNAVYTKADSSGLMFIDGFRRSALTPEDNLQGDS